MTKKKVKSTDFYNIMGIEPDATPEQIKKAYRKKALQLHPDKRGNTPEAQEEFTTMKRAYDILSDPQKREVYDQAGEDGIKLMENFGNMGPEEMSAALFRSLGAIGFRGKFFLILAITLVFSFFLLIPIFWCLRADEIVSWNWVAVFTPMWCLDAMYFCCLGFNTFITDPHQDPEDKKKGPILLKMYFFLKSLLILSLQIFIAMKLNGDVSWSLMEVFIPYFVYDALSFMETFIGGATAYAILNKDSQGAGVSTTENIQKAQKQLVGMVSVKLLLNLSRIAQAIFIALKVDEVVLWSWWGVFAPIWIYIGWFFYHPVARYFKVRAKLRENANKKQPASENPSHDGYTRESVSGEEENASNHPFFDAFCSILLIGAVTSPYFILTAKLEDATFSSLYVLLPWFIIAGMILCFICCAIACIGVTDGMDDHHSQNSDLKSPHGEEGAQAQYKDASERV